MAVDKDLVADFRGPNPKFTVSIDPSNNQPTLVGRDENGKLVKWYLYVYPNGKDYSIVKATEIDSLIAKYTNDFKKSGATQAVWDAMLASGKITKKEHDTKDPSGWYSGLVDLISSFTVGQASSVAGGTNTLNTFTGWFKRTGGSTSGVPSTGTRKDTTTSKTGYFSSQPEADNEINMFFMEQLGRNATVDERKEYFDILRAEEDKLQATKTATSTTTSTSGTSGVTSKSTDITKTVGPGGVSQADRTRLMNGVLASAIKKTPVNDLMRGAGLVAQGISELQAYAGDYGLFNYTAEMAKSNLASRLKEGAIINQDTLNAEKMNIRALSKTFYPGLGSLIDQGVKVSNIADIYTQEMQKILEIPYTSINWASDPYVSKALQNKGMDGTAQGKEGALNLNDFAIMLRNDPRWSKTQNAREEAASYANSILRSFGLA